MIYGQNKEIVGKFKKMTDLAKSTISNRFRAKLKKIIFGVEETTLITKTFRSFCFLLS